MNLFNTLFYILSVIDEGHKWQYQNATQNARKPRFYFTFLQWISILIAGIFVYSKKDGINSNIIDFLLSSMSIMTGLFLALVAIVYERMIKFRFAKSNEGVSNRAKNIKSWNLLRQFNALASYSIFLSFIVIGILIGSLLFGHDSHFPEFAKGFSDIDYILTIKTIYVVIVRFCLIYFLLDFFIIALYSICSLFQFMTLESYSKEKEAVNQGINLTFNSSLSDYESLKKKYKGKAIGYILMILFLFIGFGIYALT